MLFAVLTVQMCQNVPFLRKSCSRSSQKVPLKKASARPDGWLLAFFLGYPYVWVIFDSLRCIYMVR